MFKNVEANKNSVKAVCSNFLTKACSIWLALLSKATCVGFILSVHAFPGNRMCDLGIANASCFINYRPLLLIAFGEQAVSHNRNKCLCCFSRLSLTTSHILSFRFLFIFHLYRFLLFCYAYFIVMKQHDPKSNSMYFWWRIRSQKLTLICSDVLLYNQKLEFNSVVVLK